MPGIAGTLAIVTFVAHCAAALVALVIASASLLRAVAISPLCVANFCDAEATHAASLHAHVSFWYSSAARSALLLPHPVAPTSNIEPKNTANAPFMIFMSPSPPKGIRAMRNVKMRSPFGKVTDRSVIVW